MKKITILSLSFILLLILSCNKDDFDKSKTVVKGYLLEYGSEAPLGNVTGYIAECDGTVFGGGGCWTVDSFLTNNDGSFYHEFKHNQPVGYLYEFEQIENYYKIDWRSIHEGALNEYTHIVDPYAWLKLHVKNVEPSSIYDQIEIGGPWGGGALDDVFNGSNIDEIVIRKTRGNRKSRIVWGVKIDNDITTYGDSLYFPAHDTTFYEILY